MTKAERIHLSRVAGLGCIVCRNQGRDASPAEVHHLRGHPWSGMGMRASHYATIPLCPAHHRYGAPPELGYHSSPRAFEQRYGSQKELLEQVRGLMEDQSRW